MNRTAVLDGRSRRLIALVAFVTALTGMLAIGFGAPVAAAPAATIEKELDATQGAGFSAPNTFQTGSLVRYRLTFQCSSLAEPCGTGTIVDQLDPNLEFVQVIDASPADTTTVASSYDAATNTVTINLTGFNDGTTSEAILIARVKSTAPAGTIPNQATITVPGGFTDQSDQVDIVVPPATPQWNLSKEGVASASDPAPDTPVTYNVYIRPLATEGNVAITSYTVVDHFPVGAIVDDSAGGVVDYTTHTITWTVAAPADPSNPQPFQRYIRLIYPSTPRVPGEPTFTSGDIVTNVVDSLYQFADGSTGTDTASAQTPLVAPQPAVTTGKTGPATGVSGNIISWKITGTNTGNTTVINPVVTDTPLPAGVSGFYLQFLDGSYVPEVPQVFEQLVGGSWVPLATWTSGSTPASFGRHDLASTATGIRARPVSGAAAPDVDYGNIWLHGIVDADAGTILQNCAASTADGVTGTPSCLNTTVTEETAVINIDKEHLFTDTGAAAVTPGTTFEWSFAITSLGQSPVSVFKLADTLPAGFTYEGLACVGTTGLGGGLQQAARSTCNVLTPLANVGDFPQPTITPDVDGNGATGLVWDLDLTDGHFGITQIPAGSALVVRLFASVDAGTPVGSYTNQATFVSDLPLVCNATTGTDIYDYNGNGAAEVDPTCNANDNVDVAAAAIIDASKWDDGADGLDHVDETTGQPSATCPDDGAGYTRYPCVAQTTPGGPISYRFHLRNIGNVAATNYVMYDILPYVGDTGTSQVLSGQQRGTEWVPVLTGPVQVLNEPAAADSVIEYNLTTNPCRPELNQGSTDGSWQATCDDTWYTAAQITDWSTVRSFRVVAFQQVTGQPAPAWPPLGSIDLQADLQAPSGAPTSTSDPLDLSIAWNSLAHREFRLNADGSSARLLASEPRKVGVIIPFVLPPAYAVGDFVWIDTDRDGLQDAIEPVVPGVTVTLQNADGTPALDANGEPVAPATTDANGHYVFDNLAPGDYRVVFSDLPDGYQTTSQNNAGNQTSTDDSNTPANLTGTATTPVFTIGADLPGMTTPVATDLVTIAVQINRTIDAGLVQQVYAVGDFVWIDTDRDGLQDAGEPVVPNVTVTLQNADGTPAVDADGNPVPPSTTDANGHYVFDNLPPGEYRVVFSDLPDGYQTTSQNNAGNQTSTDDSNTPAGATGTATTPVFEIGAGLPGMANPVASDLVTIAVQINRTIDAGLVLQVYAVGDFVWIDTDRDGLQDAGEPVVPNVTVTLQNADGTPALDANGEPVAPTTTDANGHYVFDNLPPGDYRVVFSDLPSGYETTSQNNAGNQTSTDDSNTPAGATGTATTPVFEIGPGLPGMATPVASDLVTIAVQINRTIDAGLVLIPPTTTTTLPPVTTTTPDAPTTTIAVNPPQPTTPSAGLPRTGGSAGGVLVIAGIVLLSGLALTVGRRRPRPSVD